MSLEAAKEELKQLIDQIQDEQTMLDLYNQLLDMLHPLPDDLPLLTVEDLRRRAEESEEDIRAGRTIPWEKVFDQLKTRYRNAG